MSFHTKKKRKSKYRVSPLNKLKRKLDKLCAQIVKNRDNHTCQWCNKPVSGQNEHWAHIFSKGSTGLYMRWNLLNSLVLCFHCHWKWHSGAGLAWFMEAFPARYEYLNNQPLSHTIPNKDKENFMQNKLAELKAKLKELQE